MITEQHAQEALGAARASIQQAASQLESLRAAAGADRAGEECEMAAGRLRHAEEVRATFTLALVMCKAEEQAAELIALEERRRELLSSLNAYTRARFTIGGALRRPFGSRRVSAALALASGAPESSHSGQAILVALKRWNECFDAILSEQAEGIDGCD